MQEAGVSADQGRRPRVTVTAGYADLVDGHLV